MHSSLFLAALSFFATSGLGASVLTSSAEAQTYCAATVGTIECKGGNVTPEYKVLLESECGASIQAHCQAQQTKELQQQIDYLTDSVIACGTKSALAFDSLTEKNAQLRRLRRIARRAQRN